MSGVRPGEAVITLLGPRDFNGGRVERRLQKQNFVACRNFHIPVAAIERFRQTRVAGSVARQEKSRGPTGTPCMERDPPVEVTR